MLFLAIAILSLGGLVALISGVWMLALAFQRHPAWGIAVLVVPVGNIAFLCVNWREARVPFLLGMGSLLLMTGAVSTMPRGTFVNPLRMAIHAFVMTDSQGCDAAEQKMADARQQAADEIQLGNLKQRESDLVARKASVAKADSVGMVALRSDVTRYNHDLASGFPQHIAALATR